MWPNYQECIQFQRAKAAKARYVVVAEMNTGQICQSVRVAVDQPERVFLANRIDGEFISPDDIHKTVRLIRGKEV